MSGEGHARMFDPETYAGVRLPVGRASTLPAWAYTSPEWWAREVGSIFSTHWFFAAREEDARSVSDVLIRRTHLFWQAFDQGLACVERVGALLGRELAWSHSEIRASVAAYEKEVARSRAWRGDVRGTG